jgi:hypothetical protein
LIRTGHSLGRFESLFHRIDEEKREQADREREQGIQASGAQPGHEWIPEQAQCHRDHADIEPDQGEESKVGRLGLRRADGNSNLVLEGRTGRRQDLDEVGLAWHPWIGNRDRRPAQMAERRSTGGRKRPERVVHRDLRDGDRVRTVVQH